MTDFLDSLTEGVQIIGFDWRYLYVNTSAAKHGKFAKEDLIGFTWKEKYPGPENDKLLKALQNCMLDRTPDKMINDFIYPDGSSGSFQISVEPISQGILILSTDISEHKKAAAKISEHEAKYRILLETMEEGVLYVDTLGIIQYANDKFCKMLGYNKYELHGKVASNILIKLEDRPKADEINSFRIKGMGSSYDLRMKKKYGKTILMHINGTPVRNEHGVVVGSMGVHTDITKIKKTEEDIKEFNVLYSQMMFRQPVVFYKCKLQKNMVFLFLTLNVESVTGYPPYKFKTDNLLWRRKVHPDDARYVFTELDTMILAGGGELEYRWQHADGSWKWFVNRFYILKDKSGEKIMNGSWIDITERKIKELEKDEELKVLRGLARVVIPNGSGAPGC